MRREKINGEEKYIIERGFAHHVDNCPDKKYYDQWSGGPTDA